MKHKHILHLLAADKDLGEASFVSGPLYSENDPQVILFD